MMRSRASSSRSLTEMIRDNPFLCAAFLAGIALAALESNVGSASILQTMWTVLGFGFHLTASWPQKLMPEATGWLTIAMGLVLGLIPYLLADVVWRHIRNR
ncbi:hypothetical protein [Wenzhouxiangella sediminis]|uniref:Uncharacterized protein n=1 Tax=Wenzhouxiangella sediminis TaxID=1792836 RepID=A0A3E1KBL7_9GAMM|nr:hypothetical protein [Wenzhouxiangella sediminis]RFF32015.1 hypothetical protein DZC52_03205 [Wenzhouxiangella sediminis]